MGDEESGGDGWRGSGGGRTVMGDKEKGVDGWREGVGQDCDGVRWAERMN